MNLLNLFQSKPEYKKPIDQQLVDKLVDYLQTSFKHSSKIILAVDGGVNSIVAGALLKQSLGENVVALVLDFDTPKTETKIQICNYLKLETYCLKRGAAYQREVASYGLQKAADIEKFYKRFINYHLSIQSENMKAELIDTASKSDRFLDERPQGFYGHLMPFYSLYKSELYDLAAFLGIPDQFITPVSYLNLSWDQIDPVLFLLTEKQLTPEEISERCNIDLQFLKNLKSKIDKKLFQTPISQFII